MIKSILDMNKEFFAYLVIFLVLLATGALSFLTKGIDSVKNDRASTSLLEKRITTLESRITKLEELSKKDGQKATTKVP